MFPTHLESLWFLTSSQEINKALSKLTSSLLGGAFFETVTWWLDDENCKPSMLGALSLKMEERTISFF